MGTGETNIRTDRIENSHR